ncbi:MAG: CBS domain-containing protein [Gammaproteobacteria bacterium]|nr:CBS domain-containing protein [Gammaproteobacteria bacterium]NNC68427.1 CBS domain-containing protein [Gammaproteobacteria bacterium]
MDIKDLLNEKIVTVEMDDSLRVVKEIFDNTNFHHLLVVERGKLYGVISDRDLLKAINPNIGTIRETVQDAAVLNKKVHQIMTRKLITLGLDASFYDVLEIFDQHKVSCIPIVDAEKKALGIISWRDILRAIKSDLDERR